MSQAEIATIGLLRTEQVDAKYKMLDTMSVGELVAAMNEADTEVPLAISKIRPRIERAIEAIVERMSQGGRLIYLGAGTSGRLGVLDAAECGPTFSVGPEEVIAFIAGGDNALKYAAEGAEDRVELGIEDLKSINVGPLDSVVGIAASGRTPYVIGAVDYAKSCGALTIGISSNPDSELSRHVDHALDVDSGPEVLSGSTRLKSGTAQKLVLNMISTISMIRLGKTFGNLMVDLQVTNEKLQDRAVRIIISATDAPREVAEKALTEADLQVKVAIVMILLGIDAQSARTRLAASDNRIRQALN